MRFKPIWKTNYINFGALYECPVCHRNISTPHDGTPDFCDKCGIAFEWESDEEKRQNFAKQILDYWDKQGTEQTILFLKDIAEIYD